MNKLKAFMLRLPPDERERAKRIALESGCSENRLYADLIHEGLLMREQMLYMQRMRALGSRVSADEALAILQRVPDVEPDAADRMA